MIQLTFILIKPDGVHRKLVGEIIRSFEQADLQIVGLRMLIPSREILAKHYPETKEWFFAVGNKTIDAYKIVGMDVKRDFGTRDKIKIGKLVKGFMIDFISSGPCVAIALKGNLAIFKARQICGTTMPAFADIYSVRGKFCSDSADYAYNEKRSVHNLLHASSNIEEANNEINLWFPELI